MYANLVSEQLSTSLPIGDEDNRALEEQAAHKRYSIRLSRKKWPFNLDISHQLVIKSVARFSTAEVLRLFEIDDFDESKNNIGVQFVNYFVRLVESF